MTYFQCVILLAALLYCKANTVQNEFEDFVDYVNNYIDYTIHYSLPTNNSYLVNVNDSRIHDYGTFDFIIVGAGTAGTLLTRRLTEITDWNILLLEAGNNGNNFTDIPFMNLFTRNSEYNWGFKTIPQNNSCLGMVDHKCVYPTGKGLGGSAIIGDSVYARGNKADFNAWADLGLDGWSHDDLLPYFKKTEKIDINFYDEGYHGTDGLLSINYTYPNPVTYDAFLDANLLSGLKSVDYNGKNQIGIGKFQWTLNFNKKVTGGNAFITPVIENTPNLKVTLNAYTSKIIFSNKNGIPTATSVQFIKGGRVYNAYASKEVILSAGPIGSPQLLMLSGVGPQEDLENLNIPVIKNLPVGENLIDHPAFVGLYIRTNLTTDPGNVTYNLERWIKGLGYYTTIFSADNIGFINTKNKTSEIPNVEFLTINPPTSVPSASFYNLDKTYAKVFTTYNTLTDFLVYCINIEPKSHGWLKLSSSDPADFPLINPAYYTDPNDEDIQAIYEGIKYILSLLETKPLQAINATLVTQTPNCDYLKEESEKDYWYCAIRSLTSTLYHPSCTTRMGNSEKDSVVDKTLKVHGISGLRVVDAGSMPKLVRGHPLAAIWAMAEKTADLIKKEYKKL
ncbi:glucose dehydrogenase [FAD, quinone]-like [Diorhabda carinulata]|uniref:glucose dehydrogenase [FAD, quinone]-like n=1 Tax=Diorhabda carinulata TaxID=1163345 RepID=UPI0025A13AE5|nr:glucose dehydrogenase [FAD, quinone]-like [Diorhabda carinulata]